MNKTTSEGVELVKEICLGVGTTSEVGVVICPPFTALESCAATLISLRDPVLGLCRHRRGYLLEKRTMRSKSGTASGAGGFRSATRPKPTIGSLRPVPDFGFSSSPSQLNGAIV